MTDPISQRRHRKTSGLSACLSVRTSARLFLLIISVITFSGACATLTQNIREARNALNAGDYDKAVELLQAELKKAPEKTELRTLLFRAKLNKYYYHLARARTQRQAGNREGARIEYDAALAVFPNNTKLQEEADASLSDKLPQVKEVHSAIKPPVTLRVNAAEKVSLNLKSTPLLSIFRSLGKTFGVNFIFDKDFRDFPYSINVENVGFYDILNQLCMVSSGQYRILDSATVLIYPDIFNKKKSFDLRGIQTYYLSNIKAEDAKKMLMTVFRDEQLQIMEDANLNALVVRADYNSLLEIERFIANIDKAKAEVEFQIEIMELNRTLIKKIGADFGSTLATLNVGQIGEDNEVSKILDLKNLSDTGYFLTLPSVALNFLESDANNKIIAKPNLRGLDGEDISFMVGDEVPIPETQYQAIAAGGISTSPVTTYRYKNVGVEIKLTPTVHQEGEVSVKIKLTINFLSGSAISSSFPVLGKREIENKIRLKENETNIIGGFLRDDIRRSLAGFPALARIPILGSLFGNTDHEIIQTDLIFSITPRIIRQVPVEPGNRQTIWLNLGPAASTGEHTQEPKEREGARPARREKPAGSNAIHLLPSSSQVPTNTEVFLYVNMSSDKEIASLTLNGSFAGAVAAGDCEILELKTDFFPESDAKVFKNISGSSFDLGLSFVRQALVLRDSTLAQVKVRFLKKGNYTFAINSVNAYDASRNSIEISPASVPIEVF